MGNRFRPMIYAGGAIALGLYAVGHLTGSQGVSALMEKRQQIQQLQKETQSLREENKERDEYLKDLKTNPDLQRRLVRERLHYVDEGAVDFNTPSESKPAEASPAAH